MSRKYWIETYGCQMNKAESEALEYKLKINGWIQAENPDSADIVILNTCSVRQTAENRIWGRLGFFKNKKKDSRLVVVGCMAERLKKKIIERVPHVDILVGNFQKQDLIRYLENPIDEHICLTGRKKYQFDDMHSTGGKKAYVPIMHGCNNFCSYCIVPYVRGFELSRKPDKILDEISLLDKAQVREVTLLGQNVNSYLYNPESGTLPGEILNFTGLIKKTVQVVNNIKWLRFLSSHPKDFSSELIEFIAEEKVLCRHIHLPVQHGSDRILNSMKRGYTCNEYLRLVEIIKKTICGVTLTTDILIGFPGETEEDLQMTLDLMEQVEFSDAFTYRYNPREGTEAYLLGDTVPDTVKRERLTQVIELQRNISKKLKTGNIGKRFNVLVESVSKKNKNELLARTEQNDTIIFPGSTKKIGHFVQVEITSLKGSTLLGKEIH